MRAASRHLAVFTALATFASASCSSTAPERTDVTGHWLGTTVMTSETWNVDLTMTQRADSVVGRATVVSVPARVNTSFDVTGSVVGDSLRLLLRPIEDADIHIVAGTTAGALAGRLWLNNFTDDAHAIAFARQSTP